MPSIIHLQETNSTNTYLKALLLDKELDEGAIVSTKNQTAGRGQIGTKWESENGKNLTFSMVLFPTFLASKEQFIISQLVSLAIKDILDKYISNVAIKWPNDIYYKEEKICGILIENTLCEKNIENTIIGIGLNVNQEKFISSAPNPISMKMISGKEYNLIEILKDIQQRILFYYDLLKKGELSLIRQKYNHFLYRKEGFHTYSAEDETFLAQIIDVEPTGHLILETQNGKARRFTFKEVKFTR